MELGGGSDFGTGVGGGRTDGGTITIRVARAGRAVLTRLGRGSGVEGGLGVDSVAVGMPSRVDRGGLPSGGTWLIRRARPAAIRRKLAVIRSRNSRGRVEATVSVRPNGT